MLAYRTGPELHMGEREYFILGTVLRDQLEAHIPSYAVLFAKAP